MCYGCRKTASPVPNFFVIVNRSLKIWAQLVVRIAKKYTLSLIVEIRKSADCFFNVYFGYNFSKFVKNAEQYPLWVFKVWTQFNYWKCWTLPLVNFSFYDPIGKNFGCLVNYFSMFGPKFDTNLPPYIMKMLD